jgi:hypothetical protein
MLLTKHRLQPSPTFLEVFHTGIMAKQRCSDFMSPVRIWRMSLGICRYQYTVVVL